MKWMVPCVVVDKHQNFTRIPFQNSNASFSKSTNRERIQVFRQVILLLILMIRFHKRET
ncbi:hypothetical protein ABEW19_17005 [Paenibacillus illinoisensis]|uniref:hypothetical protein n=1 Tax=Paenibacillus illinoisensis TaxID=59845 RepID=UPI003D2BFD3C